MTDGPSAEMRSSVLTLLAAVKFSKDDEDEVVFAACWAREAHLSVTSNGVTAKPLDGRDTILAFYRRVWETGGHGIGPERETHVAEHPHIIETEAGGLLARHSSSFFNWTNGGPNLIGFGQFHDEIIFEEGAWRIADRRSDIWRRR